jgi:MerR-like DNA binding protein
MWTMDELVERVSEALAAEYPGAPNGRVRDVPDRRAIRWYTSIGLVDRPLGMRGRTALYGPRHLQQLVAIKRRQAAGRSLAEIQGEFNWISPDKLIEVSQVPARLLETDGSDPGPPAHWQRQRFWAEPPTADAPEPAGPEPAGPEPARQAVTTRPIAGVTLGGGVILLVPHPLSDTDRADLAAAAAPLLDLLEARGLTDGSSA